MRAPTPLFVADLIALLDECGEVDLPWLERAWSFGRTEHRAWVRDQVHRCVAAGKVELDDGTIRRAR
jgi:hypothetical protein